MGCTEGDREACDLDLGSKTICSCREQSQKMKLCSLQTFCGVRLKIKDFPHITVGFTVARNDKMTFEAETHGKMQNTTTAVRTYYVLKTVYEK
jgi:hypothetical protein